MKNKLLIILLFIVLTSPTIIWAKASADAENDIVIDGSFDDWNGKPFVKGDKHDGGDENTQNWNDFLEVGYFADDEYLYLHVTRLAAKKSEDWKFYVIMENALEGTPESQNPPEGESFSAPQFEIISSSEDERSHNGTSVEVWFEGDKLETTLSADDNNKEIEFRIPLREVGLNGFSKEIIFLLKSEKDEEIDKEDWIPNDGTITVTSGPTYYEFSSVLFFIGVAFLAYKAYSRKSVLRK